MLLVAALASARDPQARVSASLLQKVLEHCWWLLVVCNILEQQYLVEVGPGAGAVQKGRLQYCPDWRQCRGMAHTSKACAFACALGGVGSHRLRVGWPNG